MTRSDVTLCSWNSSAPLAGNTGLYSQVLCPPYSPVDYIICGLMQERVYIVQTRVRDTSRCDQRLEAAPHWHMGKQWQNVSDEAVGQWRKRLRASMRQKDITLNIC